MTDRHFASMQRIPNIAKEWFNSMVPPRQDSRAIGRFTAIVEFSLTIVKRPEIAEVFKQLVVAQ